MATMEQLLEALKNADAAGDNEAARQFASIINSARSPAAPELPPPPEEEPLGFMGLLTEGAKRTVAATKLAGAAATGDFSDQAENVAEGLKSIAKPPELKEAETAFREEAQMIRDAPSWYSPGALKGAALGVLELGKQVITNPKGLAYMTAEQAANMAPGILGNLAGLAAASATGVGTVPAMVMAVGGGFVGQTPIETGSELTQLIGSELAKRKLEPNLENIQSVITDTKFMDNAVKSAFTKGATTAAIDSAFTLGAGSVATAPGRAALKKAEDTLLASGVVVDKVAVRRAADDILANRTILQRTGQGAKAVGLDVVGGGASEAAGQQAAYGEINPEDVFQEMLGELGGAAIEIPALAKVMKDKALRGATPPPPGATPPPPGATPPVVSPAGGPATPPTRTAADFGLTEDELKNYISTIDRSIFGIDSQLTGVTAELNRTDLTGAQIRQLQDDRRRLQHSRSELKKQRDYYAPPPPKPRKSSAGSFVPLDQVRQVILAAGDEANPGDWSKALEAAFPQLAGKDKGRVRGIILGNLKKAGHISGQVKGKRTIIPGDHWNQPIVEPARKGTKAPTADITGVDLSTEAQRLADEEAQRLADEEAQRLADEEAQRLADEEAQRLAAEAEAQRLAAEAEAQRLAAEAEAQRLAAEAEDQTGQTEQTTPAPSNYARALEYVNQPNAKLTVDGLRIALGIKRPEAAQLINQLREANVIETKGNKNVLRSAQPAAESTGTGVPTTGGRSTISRKRAAGAPVPGGVGTAGDPDGQSTSGEANVPGALETEQGGKGTGRGKGKKETKAEKAKKKKAGEEAADRKTSFIPSELDRETYRQTITTLREAGAMSVDTANKLIKRLAADGTVGRPSMTEQTFNEMVEEINNGLRILERGRKPEATPAGETSAQKREAVNKAWLDAVNKFEKSFSLKQKNQWNNGLGDVSKMGLSPAQKQLYLEMEELRSEFDTLSDEAAREAAASAVVSVEDTDTQVGLALSNDYAARQRANLVGQQITSPEDLAVLAQVYRDPRFETFRVIFVDAYGKVVAQVGLTSRLPTAAIAMMGKDFDSYMQQLLSAAKNAGATGYYLLHNHPSGKAEPSTADRSMTAEYASRSKDVEFKGHVVIDTNQYSVIDGRGNFNFFQKDFGQPEPYRAAEWAATTITNPDMVIELAKRLQVDSNAITLIHTDNNMNVLGVSTIPFSATANTPVLRKQMLRGSRAVRATHVFAISRNMDALKKIKDFVVDAVHIDPTGRIESLRQSGIIIRNVTEGKLYPDAAKRRVQLSPDTTPQFDYLRANQFNKPPAPSGVAAPRSRYQTRQRIPAPRRRANTFDENVEQGTKDLEALQATRITWVQRLRSYLPTNEKYNELVRKLQNDRRVLKELQYGLELAGYLLYENSARLGRGFNNFYDRLINSSGKTALKFASQFLPDLKNLENMIRDFAKSKNVDVNKALTVVDTILKMQHYGERRRTLHMLYAPLSDKKDITITLSDGSTTTVSAAELRSKILEEVRSNKQLTDQQLDSFRNTLLTLTDINDSNNRLDPNGISQAENPGEPISIREIKKFSIDVDDAMYSPGPAEPTEIADAETYYNANKAALDPILDLVRKKIINEIKKADKEGGFWTQGVDNLTRLYGWQNYVPLKGTIRKGDKYVRVFSKLSDAIEPRGKRLSPQFNNDIPQGIVGRGPDSEPMNVILQVQIDAVKAAIRAGQQDSREAIRNAIKQGIIKDNPKLRVVVPFEERYKGFDQIKYQNNEWFVYYRPDGALEFYKLTDPRQRDAIRRSYAADPLTGVWKGISTVNTFISKNFTRWNLSFAPKDFVRNVFFAAGIFGMEMGPKKIAEFVLRTTSRIASNSMRKGWKMWKLHEAGNLAEMQRLSATDPFYKSAYEYLSKGGAVTYVQQFAGEGRLTNVLENYTKSELDKKFSNAKDALNLFLDTWVQSFEMTVRTTAYDMYKEDALNKGVSEDAAQISAAARAKELTNFESIGAEAHKLRALYAFFGASSTGAVRTLDAMRPLIVKDVATLMDELPERIKSDPVALDKARNKILQQKKNISLTMFAGVAAGAALYVMARSMAGDDEYDRNLVASDKKDQWTRGLRIPLSALGIQDAKDTDILSIPWGFGWGAFNAFGSQMMAYVLGDQSARELVGNTLQIGLDSFVPLPISRINPFDPASKLDPGLMSVAWAVDTIMPSSVRPAVEYLMNLNGLGQQLYSESRNSMSGAYQTAETVPEVYNAVAKGIEDATGGFIDYKPTTWYFIMNNYLSAVGGAASTSYGLYSWAMGNKDFVPSRDLPIVRSFFSRRTAPDAANFAKVENLVIKRKYELDKLKGLEDPTRLENYLEEHPYSETIVGLYNQYNAELNKVRERRNLVQKGKISFDTPKERTEAVKYYNEQLDRIRYSAVQSLNDWIEIEKTDR